MSEALFDESERFSFYQAVRILELLYPDRMPVGEDVEPGRETVRFKSRLEPGFPATEVESLRPPRNGEPPEMEVGFLGLGGALGPLPRAYSDMVSTRAFRSDRASRDFLDIFNHRLVSLFYRGRKKYRPVLDSRPPDEGRVSNCLLSMMGLGTPAVRGRLGIRERTLLLYTGLMIGTHRSMVGLARLVGGFFGVAAEMQPFRGEWHTLEEDQLTRIGLTGCNQELGGGAALGDRAWDQQAGFELRLGPLTYRQLLDFLPTGRAYRDLCAMVRFYAGDELDFEIRLVVAAAEVPATSLGWAGDSRLGWSTRLEGGLPAEPRLGSSGGSRLGWTSWLSTRPPDADDEQVTLAGVRL